MTDLIARLREAKEGSRELSVEVWRALCWKDHSRELSIDTPFTTDLSAAVALAERVLPGWWWRVGTCCVSDDATIGPDYNSPAHGERLHREFPLVPHEDGCGGWLVDVDQRPPHSVAKALTLAILMAKKESGNA